MKDMKKFLYQLGTRSACLACERMPYKYAKADTRKDDATMPYTRRSKAKGQSAPRIIERHCKHDVPEAPRTKVFKSDNYEFTPLPNGGFKAIQKVIEHAAPIVSNKTATVYHVQASKNVVNDYYLADD